MRAVKAGIASIKIVTLLTFVAALAVPRALSAAISVNGNLEARNQSGVHEGDIYRNFLKADVELGENLNNTVVKVILRGEDDSIHPEKVENTATSSRNYLSDDYSGSRRVYLREACISHDIYFDSLIDSISLKMGRIIYTWGNADEQKPVDIINPQDYSNLYFTPIQERKIGVFSGSISLFFTENFFIEGVVVPEFRSSELASTVFTTREMKEVTEDPGNIYTLKDPVTPDKKNSENSYAGRIGLMIFDVDMHANYYYGYDHLPVNRLKIVAPPPALSIAITPEYERIQMFGFDFQRALIYGVTLRGEGAYFDRGKYFNYDSESFLSSPLVADLSKGGTGSVEKGYAQYTAGFDDHDFIFEDLYLNLQFSQKIIMDYDKTLAQDKYVNHLLWTVKYFMANKKYCISTKGAYNLKEKSTYANAEFLVKFTDNFEFMLGGWILEGDEDTEIGQFDHYDMVYIAGKYTF